MSEADGSVSITLERIRGTLERDFTVIVRTLPDTAEGS